MPTTITLPSSNYTARTFDSWVIELRSKKNAAFPSWTDDTTPNFGNILLELFAHTLDVASFYQNQQFKETRVVFAKLRSSMIALGKNLGFVLPGASPATADLEFTFADGNPRTADLIVPSGTVVATADGSTVFESTAAATIPAGQIQVTGVPSENAFGQIDPFVAPGTPGFKFPLSASPHVDGSDVVVIGADTWASVTDFYTSGPTDKVFRVDVDAKGFGTLVFGDGVNGAIPSGSGTDSYKTGGGSSGNVDGNKLVVFRDGNRFPTVTGENVALTVRNPASARGGVDQMSVEEARVAIPAFVRTAGKRSVTHQDFVDNSLKVRGVARAMLLTADDVNTVPENTGELYVVPVGGGLPSSQLKTQVRNFILNSFPPTLTFAFSVHDPVLQIVSISARVFLNRNVSHVDTRAAIERALTNLFALLNPDGSVNTAVDFGFKIRTEVMPPGSLQALFPWSAIFDAIADAVTTTGVKVLRSVDKNSVAPGLDVVVPDTSFPTLGSVSLIDGDTNTSF